MSIDRRQILACGLAAAGIAPVFGQASPADRLTLWDNRTGPHLRGAVLVQRRVYPQIDGPEFLGPGPVGSPVSDQALAGLAASGANLVVLSHPGIVSETPPYRVDRVILEHLQDMVARCARLGLFVVIGFRTGPGRSEFTFHRDSGGSWFPQSMINENIWASYEAHDGWSLMWRETAQRFRNAPNLVGYLLMVEPNANQAAPSPGGSDLDEWNVDRLRDRVHGTPADWPALARRLIPAVREQDPHTPILVSPDGYAHAMFEPALDLQADSGLVLAVHDYSPRAYTHQGPGENRIYERNGADFVRPRHDRWMMGELGVSRWAPGAADYLSDRLQALEAAGAGWSYFHWGSGWQPYERQENRFNPSFGTEPDIARPQLAAPLERTLSRFWQRNTLLSDRVR